jgi:hypothetical protein
MSMAERIIYVYGIVPASLTLERAPAGLDDGRLELVRHDEIAALISHLDAAAYPAEVVEANVGDVAWVGPRAVAHDQVLTWASEAGAVIPLPMFALYREPNALETMLRERAERLRDTLRRVEGAREYAVRVFRLDDVLAARVSELSPMLAELERAAKAASPGQRYLLERKAESERSGEIRRIASAVARESFDALRSLASDGAREAIPQRDGERGTAVLNAFFLVPNDAVDAFRRELTALVSRHEPNGFRFEFTGPWPPYHFVRDAA